MAGVVRSGSVGYPLTEEQAYALPPLTLAYVGDAVWELHVRMMLVLAGERQPRQLHKLAVGYVKAGAQADRIHALQERLSEREQQVVRRGRNAKSATVPRGASVADYRSSTGLEALLGYLHLAGQDSRLQEIMQWLIEQGGQ
ncbi:MAG: ribonuclease III [Firmicutes bacterium]|nr:ribonuclease III [Bacillota bacterium]